MNKWYLIHTKPKEESRACENLINQGFDIFLPWLQTYRLKKGKQVKAVEPLFPRYLFIALDQTISQWYKIRSTRGVTDFVRFSEMPTEVPAFIVDDLKNQADNEGLIDQTDTNPHLFRSGDRVRITSGSFNGWDAIVREQEGDQRVILLITMLGRQQKLKLPLSAVSPAY